MPKKTCTAAKLKKRKSGWCCVFKCNGKQVERSLGTKIKRNAEKHLAELNQLIDSTPVVDMKVGWETRIACKIYRDVDAKYGFRPVRPKKPKKGPRKDQKKANRRTVKKKESVAKNTMVFDPERALWVDQKGYGGPDSVLMTPAEALDSARLYAEAVANETQRLVSVTMMTATARVSAEPQAVLITETPLD